jgi:hypothetical protein
MHFHLPKPLHGWRELVGEVGIIVVGVLIALAAEQFVEWIRWQGKVHSTEQAIRRDLALAADLSSERVAIRRCLDDRLDALSALVKEHGPPPAAPPASDASGFPMISVYKAPARVWTTQVWSGVMADGTVEHLNPDRARALGLLYFTLGMAQEHNRDEQDEGPKLGVLRESGLELSPDKKVELLQSIARLRSLNEAMYWTSRQVLRRIHDVGYLPPEKETIARLAGKYSRAMECKYARADLKGRVLQDWFTLNR